MEIGNSTLEKHGFRRHGCHDEAAGSPTSSPTPVFHTPHHHTSMFNDLKVSQCISPSYSFHDPYARLGSTVTSTKNMNVLSRYITSISSQSPVNLHVPLPPHFCGTPFPPSAHTPSLTDQPRRFPLPQPCLQHTLRYPAFPAPGSRSSCHLPDQDNPQDLLRQFGKYNTWQHTSANVHACSASDVWHHARHPFCLSPLHSTIQCPWFRRRLNLEQGLLRHTPGRRNE